MNPFAGLAHVPRYRDHDVPASPFVAALPQLGLLCALHSRLGDRDRAVSVRGILLVDRLLTQPRSPVYSSAPEEVLADALSDAIAALDPVPLEAAA